MTLHSPRLSRRPSLWLTTILAGILSSRVTAQSFRSDSKRFDNSKMDIVITETERQARTSVVDIHITAIGSSVGSSFSLLCGIRDLTKERGNYRYIAKAEEQPHRNQMLIGFLASAAEPPERLDPRLAGQLVIDLDYFALICDKMQWMSNETIRQVRDRLARMRTPLSSFRHTAWSLILLTLALASTTSIAATTAYMSSTEQLDLRQVPLIVVAPDKLKAVLHHRALTLFAEAGLPIPGSDLSQRPPSAVLTLTLDSRPIDDLCPGKVLYAPSLALTEPVTIPRIGSTIRDTTWLIESDKEVRGPVDDERITTDLDGFVRQFITDYKTANRQPQERPATPDMSVDPQFSLTPSPPQQQTDRDLQKIRVLSLSILAGRWTSALRANAERQLTEAGLRLVPNAGENGAISMSLELTQRADDRCPGKVLYEQGLYLVEQVRVTRRPMVSLWSDTWLQESVRIVPPRSLRELERDQRLLLQEFLQSHATR